MSSSVREEMIEIDYSRARSKTIFLRHFWKPIAYMAVGGTAVAIWFEEFLDVSSNLLGCSFCPFLRHSYTSLTISYLKPIKINKLDFYRKGGKKVYEFE